MQMFLLRARKSVTRSGPADGTALSSCRRRSRSPTHSQCLILGYRLTLYLTLYLTQHLTQRL